MFKVLFLFFILVNAIFANDKVEIFATTIESEDSVIKASGDVVVVYKEYYLSASKAVYDKKTGDLELFENVRANQNNEYKLLGNYAKLNIKLKERSFQPFYMLEEKSQVWISADKGCAKDKDFEITSGVVSGCNPNDPLWKMEFSSSDYNFDDKWLNLYNTRIYIYDIPVFYTPWFGYSLDTTRRSGLLQPSFGLSDSEGFYYEQPIYIAEQDSWDLELKPQLRTSRGSGVYSNFRFVDSKISKGEFKAGYFKEKESYFLENNLANDAHYGFNLKYENSDFLHQWFNLDLSGESGLFVDINYMNDVDYINLESSDIANTTTAAQTLSRINLFYNMESDYFGAYFKHYQDLTVESNENTLQKLPTLHYHHYLETLLDDKLIYNLDIQSNNIYRKINKKVIQTDLNLPISFNYPVFDEHLNLSYKTNVYAQHSSFSGTDSLVTGDEYKDGYILRNENLLSASTQLTKAYDEYAHVISLGTSYSFEGGETTDNFYDYNKEYCSDIANQDDARCEFYGISAIKEELKVDFSQYIYDSLGKQKLYHRLSQSILYTETQTLKGDLENELEYQITDNFNIYNNTFYSHNKSKLAKVYNKVSYNDYGMLVSLSHLYKNEFKDRTTIYSPFTSYMTSTARYTYDEHYSYFVSYDYDLELDEKKRAEIGFLYKKRCWDFGLKYSENNRPVLNNTGTTSNIYERYIYFSIALKPLMPSATDSSAFAWRLPKSFGEE